MQVWWIISFYNRLQLYTSGWWFGIILYSHILRRINPTDEFIFFRGVAQPPTRYKSLPGMRFTSNKRSVTAGPLIYRSVPGPLGSTSLLSSHGDLGIRHWKNPPISNCAMYIYIYIHRHGMNYIIYIYHIISCIVYIYMCIIVRIIWVADKISGKLK